MVRKPLLTRPPWDDKYHVRAILEDLDEHLLDQREGWEHVQEGSSPVYVESKQSLHHCLLGNANKELVTLAKMSKVGLSQWETGWVHSFWEGSHLCVRVNMWLRRSAISLSVSETQVARERIWWSMHHSHISPER